ncbi:MAG: hypothetical protein ABJP45_03310 [Cyclobacteriaceae bacterium]
MDNKNTALIIAMIGKIASDNAFNKAMNAVILKELSLLTNSDHEELTKSAQKLQAEFLLTTNDVFQDLVKQTYGKSTPSHVEDFVK